jgi:hypothetical protein
LATAGVTAGRIDPFGRSGCLGNSRFWTFTGTLSVSPSAFRFADCGVVSPFVAGTFGGGAVGWLAVGWGLDDGDGAAEGSPMVERMELRNYAF